ncbi:hypothetical protein [Spirosoma montaniterrae]|uniref:Uncharacterized protein n=1 Tax=Spirosoma montaniterrae TaxID=1178516 RepID=A0A1P9WSY1_9BACT|nr:hypothetical protein [Spirosoma montaniterrae]AQG78494.1 hypothetical protein AWR27_03545 [Spirosoma montaniterrae]
MKFTSSLGSFELSIVGYGKKVSNWRERNRLQCRFSTHWRQQTDTQSVPLQTWEVSRLLSGLRSLWNKAANHIELTFTNPGLSVEATALPNEQYRLQIQLDNELTPSWHQYPDFPVSMDMTLNRNQLQEAIKDLSGQLAAFPER